jgi:hypothetical protein
MCWPGAFGIRLDDVGNGSIGLEARTVPPLSIGRKIAPASIPAASIHSRRALAGKATSPRAIAIVAPARVRARAAWAALIRFVTVSVQPGELFAHATFPRLSRSDLPIIAVTELGRPTFHPYSREYCHSGAPLLVEHFSLKSDPSLLTYMVRSPPSVDLPKRSADALEPFVHRFVRVGEALSSGILSR